ncbi:MAG TPA: phosphohistidine phosphatase SixA [Candidatus Solibacter sp.]|jgi:phosphohistidine phosphatase|nr:phosphohistidine phosphatase SixA [Candidatus Solibacter sp.]
MIVYFLRHASAGKHMLNATKNERRPLDEEGVLQARYVGRLLTNLDVQVECIISSPLKRAMQTASLVANELAFENPVHTEDALRPEAPFEQFQHLIAQHRRHEAIILVGHNPNLTEFLSKTISENTGAAQVDFKKGAVAKVELRGRSGTLHWLVTPKIARALQNNLKSNSLPKTSLK